MPGDTPQADQQEQGGPLSPRRPGTVVAVALLDVTGVVVTVAAAAVLALNDETDRRWWWAVGLASVLAVFTTVLLIRIEAQRRSFIEASTRFAERMEQLADGAGPEVLREADDLWEFARHRRDEAFASGDLALAERLSVALAIVAIRRREA